MKEKIKKFFTNKENLLIIYMVFMSIFGFLLSYLGGLAAFNHDANNTTINAENKKLNDNISTKRAVESNERYSPYSTIGEEVKVALNINENLVVDLLNNTNITVADEPYYLFSGGNGEDTFFDLSLSFFDLNFPIENYVFNFYLEFPGSYFEFYGKMAQNQLIEYDHSDFFDNNNYTNGLSSLVFLEKIGNDLLTISNTYLTDMYFTNNTYIEYQFDSEILTNYVYTYDIQQPTNFLTEFLNSVANITLGVGGVLTQAVIGVGTILFFNEELTIVGVGLAMALGVGAVYLIFRMVRGLIKRNDRG